MKALLVLPLVLLTVSAAPEPRAGPFCGLCVRLITEAETLEQQFCSTEQKCKQNLDKTCDAISRGNSILDSACKGLVAHYLPVLFPYLQNNAPPRTVCRAIRLCTGVPETAAQAAFQVGPQVGAEKSSWECTICKDAIGMLDNQLQSPGVENTLKGYFLQACDVIPPGQDQQVCKNVINQYFPQIWAQIMKFLDADAICSDIGVCKSRLEEMMVHRDNPLGNLGCTFCKSVFTWFQKEILTNQTETQMIDAINKVCNDIPNQDYAQKCSEVMDKYGKMLFEQVVRILGPDNICKAVKACPSSKRR